MFARFWSLSLRLSKVPRIPITDIFIAEHPGTRVSGDRQIIFAELAIIGSGIGYNELTENGYIVVKRMSKMPGRGTRLLVTIRNSRFVIGHKER